MAGPEDYAATKTAVAKANAAKKPTPKPAAKPAEKPAAKPAATPTPKSKTTPDERARESGKMYGSDNTGVVPRGATTAAADEAARESGVYYGSGNQGNEPVIATETGKNYFGIDQDAFARLMGQLEQWGLGSLSDVITKLLTQGKGFDEIMTKIKYDNSLIDPNNPNSGRWNDAYNKRFAGNVSRTKRGLNALSEREYLAQEDSYAETLSRYGLKDMLSLKAEENQAKFADWMSKDISPDEFKTRIDTAFTEVLNLDPAVKKNFQTWYPSLTNQDLVSYFLSPEDTVEKLKTKAYAAQIGAAANQQGLIADKSRSEMFAQRGMRYEQAQQAYGDVAGAMPGGKKLSDIYNEEKIQYNQETAEDEYLGQSAEAKLKRNRLASKERAMFGGDSGVNSASLNKAISI